mgnify:CR=1 FL=1
MYWKKGMRRLSSWSVLSSKKFLMRIAFIGWKINEFGEFYISKFKMLMLLCYCCRYYIKDNHVFEVSSKPTEVFHINAVK